MPADRVGQDAAGEQSDRATGRGDEAVDTDRFRLLARLREHRHDHPQDHSGGERAADSLDEACSDQHLLALREGAKQRGADEDDQPGQEDTALPDQIAKAAGKQQQPAEGDQVSVDDPGEVALREAKVDPDRGQRDVDDRDVEDDHQHARTEHIERQPAIAVRVIQLLLH